MIRTMIVDDEKPAIAKLEALLRAYPQYQVCGAFTDANEALAKAGELQPMVAFLDIAMPGITGIDLAAALRRKLDKPLQIIFITAYDEYALSAFDVQAADYLLKPVGRARFHQMIERLNSLLPKNSETGREEAAEPEEYMIRLFGKLEITGSAAKPVNWRTAKVRELFALFMHNRSGIYRDSLLEILWPDMEPERALSSLNTCNYFLRQYLSHHGERISLHYEAGYYRLETGNVPCDTDRFTAALEQSASIHEGVLSSILAGADLYRGRYLEDVKGSWIGMERERYEANYITLRENIAGYQLKNSRYDSAISNAMRALEINPLHPPAWKVILETYHRQGDPVQLKRARENMYKTYQEKTGREPANELYNQHP